MTASESNALKSIVDRLRGIGDAITPAEAAPGRDANGGYVSSLTEAVMGMTAGLVQIAGAIETLADAVRKSR